MEETWQTSTNTHPHIVLADDDSDDRELFEEAVTVVDPRIKISMAKDGEELMELLKTNSTLDMIFLDLNMPFKNGFQCLDEIRSIKAFQDLFIILYSTTARPVVIDSAFRKGASLFIQKPNSFSDLKQILLKVFTSGILEISPSREGFVLGL